MKFLRDHLKKSNIHFKSQLRVTSVSMQFNQTVFPSHPHNQLPLVLQTAHQITPHYRVNHSFTLIAIIHFLCYSHEDHVILEQPAFVCFLGSLTCSLFLYVPHSGQLANGPAFFLSAVWQKNDWVFSTWTEISHTGHIQMACSFAGWLRINNEWVSLPTQALKSHWTITVSSQTHTSGRFYKVLELCHLPLELICTLTSVLLICKCFKTRRAGITRQPVPILCNPLSMSDLKARLKRHGQPRGVQLFPVSTRSRRIKARQYG